MGAAPPPRDPTVSSSAPMVPQRRTMSSWRRSRPFKRSLSGVVAPPFVGMAAAYLARLSRESGHPVTAIFATSSEIRNTGVVKNAETNLDAVQQHDGKT